MKAKNICNYIIVILTMTGLIIVSIDPDRIGAYQTFLFSIAPLLGAWMAAIWGGKFSNIRRQKAYQEENHYDDDGRVSEKMPDYRVNKR